MATTPENFKLAIEAHLAKNAAKGTRTTFAATSAVTTSPDKVQVISPDTSIQQDAPPLTKDGATYKIRKSEGRDERVEQNRLDTELRLGKKQAGNVLRPGARPVTIVVPDIDITQSHTQAIRAHEAAVRARESTFVTINSSVTQELRDKMRAEEHRREGTLLEQSLTRVPTSPIAPSAELVMPSDEELRKMWMERHGITEKKVEQAEQKLLDRKEAATKKLEAHGLTNLEKGKEAFKKMNPWAKFALGVGFSGLAVATGGTSGIVLAAIPKGMAIASFASGLYDKELARKLQDGEKINKMVIGVKSLVLGTIIAFGTSVALSHIADGVKMMTPIASDIMDSIKSYMHSAPTAAVDTTSAPPVDVSTLPTVTDHAVPLPPELDKYLVHPGEALTSYTIAPGDNITKVILERVYPSILGAMDLPDELRENMVQNLIHYAGVWPTDPDFTEISKFANPDLIRPGETIDLGKLHHALTEVRFEDFGGKTLMEHAKELALKG